MKFLELLGVILLSATLASADSLAITSPSSSIPLASNQKVTEKGILLPTLLVAGTLSLFASRPRANGSKGKPGESEKRTFIQVPSQEEQKNWEDEEIKFGLSVYLKLAKLVEMGKAGLRSIDTEDQDDDSDEQENHVGKCTNYDFKAGTQMEQEALQHIKNNGDEDEYDMLNDKILSLVTQAQKALKRPAAEYDSFEHLDDVGSDLEFLAFMNTVPSEVTSYSIEKKNAQMFFATSLLYLIRTGLILALFFGANTYSIVMFFLMYIVHVCILRLLSLWKDKVIVY